MTAVPKLVFYPSLLSSPFRANVSYYFAANMVRDERFCHMFSLILNHKALSLLFHFPILDFIVSDYLCHM